MTSQLAKLCDPLQLTVNTQPQDRCDSGQRQDLWSSCGFAPAHALPLALLLPLDLPLHLSPLLPLPLPLPLHHLTMLICRKF